MSMHSMIFLRIYIYSPTTLVVSQKQKSLAEMQNYSNFQPSYYLFFDKVKFSLGNEVGPSQFKLVFTIHRNKAKPLQTSTTQE